MLGEMIIISSKEGLENDGNNKKDYMLFNVYGANLNFCELQERNGIGNNQPFGWKSITN